VQDVRAFGKPAKESHKHLHDSGQSFFRGNNLFFTCKLSHEQDVKARSALER
jgi:hypothetical protein